MQSGPRKRGRPPLGDEPSVVVAFRLTSEEIAALQAFSQEEGLSLSAAVRAALAAWAQCGEAGRG